MLCLRVHEVMIGITLSRDSFPFTSVNIVFNRASDQRVKNVGGYCVLIILFVMLTPFLPFDWSRVGADIDEEDEKGEEEMTVDI